MKGNERFGEYILSSTTPLGYGSYGVVSRGRTRSARYSSSTLARTPQVYSVHHREDDTKRGAVKVELKGHANGLKVEVSNRDARAAPHASRSLQCRVMERVHEKGTRAHLLVKYAAQKRDFYTYMVVMKLGRDFRSLRTVSVAEPQTMRSSACHYFGFFWRENK